MLVCSHRRSFDEYRFYERIHYTFKDVVDLNDLNARHRNSENDLFQYRTLRIFEEDHGRTFHFLEENP